MKLNKLPPTKILPKTGIYAISGNRLADESLFKGHTTRPLDLKDLTTKLAVLKLLAEKLELPNYFKNNWDSLEECLQGIQSGSVLIFKNTNNFAQACPHDFSMLLSILTCWSQLLGLVLVEEKPSHSRITVDQL